MSGNRKRIKMPQGNILRGLFRLIQGDQTGLREFGNSPRTFSASLAPLLAFPLVGSALFALSGHFMLALVMLLSRVAAVLLQPVITEFVAGRSNSSTTWLMTSTALNWSVWLVFPLIFLGVLIANGLVTTGVSDYNAVIIAACLIAAYYTWLQWFILRTGLRLHWLYALLLVLGMNILIGGISYLPYEIHPDLLTLTLHPAAK